MILVEMIPILIAQAIAIDVLLANDAAMEADILQALVGDVSPGQLAPWPTSSDPTSPFHTCRGET